MHRPLSAKQRAFADVFAGNGTEACRLAGYRGSDNVLAQQARDNLRNPHILKYIREREERESRPLIADRKKRQEFWSTTMNNEEADIHARLRASELLGKSEADFVDRLKHEGSVSIGVVDPYAEPKE